MGFAKAVAFLLMMVVCVGVSVGAVYKVGDSAGWTILGNVDYDKWASTKSFHVGDTILFEYNKQFHNVMQVTHSLFRSCNTSDPINVYSTGNDSFTIESPGHYYFLCGFPGHCQAGQKVDIRVPRDSLTTTSPRPAPYGPTMTPSPGPAQNSAPSIFYSKLGWFMIGLTFCVSCFAY